MPELLKRIVSTLVCGAVLTLCPGGLNAGGQEISVMRTFPGEEEMLVRQDFQVIVEFSGRAEPEEFSFSISPDPGGWQQMWENGNRRVRLISSAGFAGRTRYEARVRAEKEGKEHVFSFFVSGPDSVALIDEAEEKKILTRDEARAHRMEALFEPEKLPEAYRSPTPIRCGTPVFTRLSQDAGLLEKETLERLRPYLVRPGEPGSVFEDDGDDEAGRGGRTSLRIYLFGQMQQGADHRVVRAQKCREGPQGKGHSGFSRYVQQVQEPHGKRPSRGWRICRKQEES